MAPGNRLVFSRFRNKTCLPVIARRAVNAYFNKFLVACL
jgi:hypothetical protein